MKDNPRNSGPDPKLVEQLEIELVVLCDLWEKAGIYVENLRRSIDEHGAVETARHWATGKQQEGYQEGLKKALAEFGPERTIEGVIVSEGFQPLFTVDEIASAQARLDNPQ